MAAIFAAALHLGTTSFGGPVAHLGYFRNEFVTRRKWLSESTYADLIALCQFLPGPSSSQIGFAVGLRCGGLAGGLLAFVGFTLPSLVLMIAFALGLKHWDDTLGRGWLQGMKVAAVAVVAHAVWGMARSLCPDAPRRLLALSSAVLLAVSPLPWLQVAVIAAGAGIGMLFLRRPRPDTTTPAPAPPPPEAASARPARRGRGLPYLLLFAALLLGLPLLAEATSSPALEYFDGFYRAGSLVFGGGHVVLPLLETQVVGEAWLDRETFLAGYGAAQAVPGPLFTFAGFLGAAMAVPPQGIAGGLLCTAAIFLPALLLVLGILPAWESLRQGDRVQAALRGANAVVVGLLLAALYHPVWPAGIIDAYAFALGLVAFALLQVARTPAWAVVAGAALAGAAIW